MKNLIALKLFFAGCKREREILLCKWFLISSNNFHMFFFRRQTHIVHIRETFNNYYIPVEDNTHSEKKDDYMRIKNVDSVDFYC